jgi:hypothetical protein
VASQTGALAFAGCMRAHAVSNYPDPASDGAIPKRTAAQLGVTMSRLESAQTACAHLLPNGGRGPTVGALQQSWNDFRTFARCMRSHGVANWPDPSRYPRHPERPTFDLQAAGVDPSSPRIDATARTCLPLLHGNNPQHLGGGGS